MEQIIKSAFFKSLTGEEQKFVDEFMALTEFYISEGHVPSYAIHMADKAARDHHEVKLTKENLLFLSYFWKYGNDYTRFVMGKRDEWSAGEKEVAITTHGGRRLKNRIGIEKKAQVRHLKKVLEKGINENNADGYARSYIGYVKGKNTEYNHKINNLNVVLYNSGVYIFGKDDGGSTLLITAYKLCTSTWRKIYGKRTRYEAV